MARFKIVLAVGAVLAALLLSGTSAAAATTSAVNGDNPCCKV